MTFNPISPATSICRHSRDRHNLDRHGRTGFTMVEMLTVIGIIVILMAILLPVIGKVRQQVQVAHTKTVMSQLQQAIEQYYAEYKVYPGPISNTTLTTTTISGVGGFVTSTENLTLALCGGLQNQGGTIVYNQNDVANSTGPANLVANPMMQTRHGAFINATPGQNVADLPWDPNGKSGPGDTPIPEFQDKFPARFGNSPRPILYIRAQRGNPVSPNPTANAPTLCGADDTTTQYNYTQLLKYQIANLDFKMNGQIPTDAQSNPLSDSPYYSDWNTYLGNPNSANTSGKPTLPRGKDSYILISAGLDNIFGTTDDIIIP